MPYPSDLMGTWIANNTAYGNLVIEPIQTDTNNIGTVTGTWNSVNIPVSASDNTTVTAFSVPIIFGQSFYSNGDSNTGASYLTLVAKGSVQKPDGGTLNFYLTLSGFRESGNTTNTLTATVVYDGDRAGGAHDSSPQQFAWVRQ